jgi:hypothetical protein
LWWPLSADSAVAVTTGDDGTGGFAGGFGGGGGMSKPLSLRRRCGDTAPADLAAEVVLLAAVGVGGVAGGYALPVTLRGPCARAPAILML